MYITIYVKSYKVSYQRIALEYTIRLLKMNIKRKIKDLSANLLWYQVITEISKTSVD